jgi:hypothetical protein
MLPILLLVFLREGNRAFRYGLTAALPANMRGRFFAVIYRPLFRNADGGEERFLGPYTTMERPLEERIPASTTAAGCNPPHRSLGWL